MELVFGFVLGVLGTLAAQLILAKNSSARVFTVDGRQLVELMHRKETR